MIEETEAGRGLGKRGGLARGDLRERLFAVEVPAQDLTRDLVGLHAPGGAVAERDCECDLGALGGRESDEPRVGEEVAIAANLVVPVLAGTDAVQGAGLAGHSDAVEDGPAALVAERDLGSAVLGG